MDTGSPGHVKRELLGASCMHLALEAEGDGARQGRTAPRACGRRKKRGRGHSNIEPRRLPRARVSSKDVRTLATSLFFPVVELAPLGFTLVLKLWRTPTRHAV